MVQNFMSLLKAVRADRQESTLEVRDEKKLQEIKDFFLQALILSRNGRCFTSPNCDWFEHQDGRSQSWWQPRDLQKLFYYVAFLNRVNIPTVLCETQPAGTAREPVRPFIYAHMLVKISEIPDNHEYRYLEPEAKELELIPQALKSDFITPIVKAFVFTCSKWIENMPETNIVVILDASGWSHAESAYKLSFRVVIPEVGVTMATAANIRDKVAFHFRGRLNSTAWLDYEAWDADKVLPKDAFTNRMLHPLTWCCWSGLDAPETHRWFKPFALLHACAADEPGDYHLDTLKEVAAQLKPEDWIHLGSPWPRSQRCWPERADAEEEC